MVVTFKGKSLRAERWSCVIASELSAPSAHVTGMLAEAPGKGPQAEEKQISALVKKNDRDRLRSKLKGAGSPQPHWAPWFSALVQGCGAAPLALNTLPPSNHAHGEYLLVFVQLLKPRAVAAAALGSVGLNAELHAERSFWFTVLLPKATPAGFARTKTVHPNQLLAGVTAANTSIAAINVNSAMNQFFRAAERPTLRTRPAAATSGAAPMTTDIGC